MLFLCGEYALPYQFDGVETHQIIGKYIRNILDSANPASEIEKYPYAKMTYSYMADQNASNFVSGEGWTLKHIYTCSEKVMESYNKVQFDEYQGMLSDDCTFDKISLDKTMQETFVNIIMGEPIDKFDSFVADWYKLGGESITAEVNEWYSKQQK